MKLKFTKMHGAGNDFVMIDDRENKVPWEDHFLMSALAERRSGIGSEGVVLIQHSDRADFRMRFLNPDGTEVEMCGNGSRCAAAFAHHLGIAGKNLTIETQAGLIDAQVHTDGVCIWMPEPEKRNYGIELKIDDEIIRGDYVVVGVPHFVVPVPNIAAIDIGKLGRAIRLHPVFAPDGTNVDFVTYRTPNRISTRTYERGVEAESGACGTGAVACAVVAVEKTGGTLPTQIKTSSGCDLIVDGDWRQKKCTGLTLTGPVSFVFDGEIDLAKLDTSGVIDIS